jgi:hypothetical protein
MSTVMSYIAFDSIKDSEVNEVNGSDPNPV